MNVEPIKQSIESGDLYESLKQRFKSGDTTLSTEDMAYMIAVLIKKTSGCSDKEILPIFMEQMEVYESRRAA